LAASVPLAMEVERRSCWGPQRRHLRRPAGPDSSELHQPLHALSGGSDQDLAVRPLQCPEPHPLHPVPPLGLREERLDPHLPLSHGLLARLGFVVGAYPFCVVLVEASAQQAAAVGAGAFRLQLARVADRGVGPVLGGSFRVGVADVSQFLAFGANVEVPLLV
jgi:hypothetical protein